MNHANTAGERKSIALVLGGGAPNASLMAGALEAFIEREVEFDVISSCGAGALIGLLYTVPKNNTPIAALRSVTEMGIDDLIYQAFPVNYKVFNKPGVLADAWRQWTRHPQWPNPSSPTPAPRQQQLLSDWYQLLQASLCPSDLSPQSTGLCAHVPFIDDLVDFAALPAIGPQFHISAYNLNRHQMICWDKHQIGKPQFLAALSFPFLYPPMEIDGEFYIEGAAIDTLNFKGLLQQHRLDSIVVFDVLGCERIMHPPTDLYDAWVQSIITPLIELARDDLKLFSALHNTDPHSGQPKAELLRLNVEDYLSPRETDSELHWSRSNLTRLYDVGYEAGHALCREHAAALGL